MTETRRQEKYILRQPPIPWQRAGRNQDRYFDKQAKEKNWYQLELLEQRQDHRGLQNIKYDGPLHLEVIFGLPMHVTWSGIKKTRNEGMCHSLKPDIDNLIKFLTDACNGILYEDDKQIAIVYATKIWTQKPRTEFTLTFLGNEQLVNK